MEITKEMQEVLLKKEGVVVIADATGEKRTFFVSHLTNGDPDIYRKTAGKPTVLTVG